MRGATYNQLMIFQTIVEEGSIRGAARKLTISPPTVSQALKALEQKLGLPLFIRTTRQMELTEAGHLLYGNTSNAVSALNSAMESVHDLHQEPTGLVRITVPRFVYQWLLAPIYADFCRQYPKLELEISISDATVNLIAEGLDVGIRFGHKVEQGMVARTLIATMKEALFASPDYAERHGVPQTPDQLSAHKQVKYRFISSNKLAPLTLERDGVRYEIEMPTALIVNDTDLLIDAVSKGVGIGGIIEPLIANGLSRHELVPVLEDYWPTVPGLSLYFPQNSQKARRVRVLIDFLVAHLARS
ncbi:LysR family transcriptional regulator [Neiella marina]|uniref:LysR family transcriptional regulator n=1 Tax=Neiella marina TaxID=508461 RepID=A0A8J2XNG0_9GAMM|nr:LysR family transcriptional regulator [Neiella marina]GGA71717.1 LysR family transcriptional regulator [Neiella marina]